MCWIVLTAALGADVVLRVSQIWLCVHRHEEEVMVFSIVLVLNSGDR